MDGTRRSTAQGLRAGIWLIIGCSLAVSPAARAERTSTELSRPGPVADFLQYRGRVIDLYRRGPQLIATVRDAL